ncbi:MAG: helix-turn-helix domain-containing protein [candidate division Zixibacteria bacterium]|nr:helix-turn-helix domain-containing protein [candidate division Zixibacteria bacterium]
MRPRPFRWKIELVKQGLTLQELSYRIGCDISTLSRLANGWKTPSGKLKSQIAEALGISEKRAWSRI